METMQNKKSLNDLKTRITEKIQSIEKKRTLYIVFLEIGKRLVFYIFAGR